MKDRRFECQFLFVSFFKFFYRQPRRFEQIAVHGRHLRPPNPAVAAAPASSGATAAAAAAAAAAPASVSDDELGGSPSRATGEHSTTTTEDPRGKLALGRGRESGDRRRHSGTTRTSDSSTLIH